MYDIITIGTATRDIFLSSPLFKVVRDPKHLQKLGFPTGEAQCFALGSKIEVADLAIANGGGALNSAITFSRQNLKVATVVKLGNDRAGEEIIKELKKEKITSFAVKDSQKGTASSTILLAPDGEQTVLVYRGVSEHLKNNEIPFSKLKARWAYISPGKISKEVIEKLFNYFVKNKTFITFNPSKYFIEMGINKLKPFLSRSKVVVLNREEAAELTGVDYQNEKKIFTKLDKAVPGIVAMTEGQKGITVSDGFNIYQSVVFKAKRIDATGAGDAFASGFVVGLIQRSAFSVQRSEKLNAKRYTLNPEIIKYAIRLGTANATSVVEHIGAHKGIITKKEFEQTKRWKNLKIDTI